MGINYWGKKILIDSSFKSIITFCVKYDFNLKRVLVIKLLVLLYVIIISSTQIGKIILNSFKIFQKDLKTVDFIIYIKMMDNREIIAPLFSWTN